MTTFRRISAQAWFEFTAILRNGEQILLNVIMPVLALIVLAKTDLVAAENDSLDKASLALVAALSLAVMSSAFTSVAIATGFDRRAGFLRYLGTTPLRRWGLLAGKALAVVMLVIIQIALLIVTALLIGWSPDFAGLGIGLFPILIATCTFAAWALLLAGTLRAEAVLALANLIWLFLVMTAFAILVSRQMPAAISEIASFFPSGALVAALGEGVGNHTIAIGPHLVLAGWLIAGAGATTRWFKWD
ncbi:MAG TPA: ABC transporter permease [Actinomycetales bacterium]|nr:ABC transporter permease [Actinomycetales bacterium]